MPRDGIGAPAPRPLSLHLREQRLKILSRTAKRAARGHRRVTAARLAAAEDVLGAVIEGGDFLANVVIPGTFYDTEGVALFVTMTMHDFKRLCELGAELEDDEDTHDAEPETGDYEGWLGARDGQIDQSRWIECEYGDGEEEADNEPSLGSTHIINQERWREGFHAGDNERDRCDEEANGDVEPSLGAPEPAIAVSPTATLRACGNVIATGSQEQWGGYRYQVGTGSAGNTDDREDEL